MKWINKVEFGKFSVEQYQEDEEMEIENGGASDNKKKDDNKNKNNIIILLTMNDNENRFNPVNIKYINQALDYIETIKDVGCLITTSSDPKYYSLGLDLDFVKPRGKSSFLNLLYDLSVLIQRVLVFPIPTISAINGHTIAGGCIFSLAHDYRIMRDDKGFFCVNAIDNCIPLPPGLISILKCKINNPTIYRDIVFAGKRYGGIDSEKLQLIDKATPNYLLESIKLAKQISGKDKLTYGCLKLETFKLESLSLLNKDLGESLKYNQFD